jgi:asparagine synthase (glutamine-hydrolysing)
VSGLLAVYDASGIAPEPDRYRSALRRLVHRGPDGEGTLLREDLFLGVRFSSINAGGPQPALGADGKVAVVLDGHIHNRQEVARALRARGTPADVSSDAALLAAAYAEFGEGCFERLIGVWAALVWDERTRELLASRDRLGVRPLYYFSESSRFLLASEAKAILALDARAREMDRRRVREFVRSGRIDDWADTLFARVRPVPPGSNLRIRADRVAGTRYWTLRPAPAPGSTAESILDRLAAAVERTTPTGVRVGLSLSGGIDSASIAGVLAQSSLHTARDLRAFSITPPKTTDESALIDATVRHTGIPHSYVGLEGLDYPRSLAELIDAQDEPVQSSGVFYQYVLRRRMAEAGCRAVLVGYGADEIFGGYDYLAPSFLLALLADGRLPAALRFVRGGRHFLGMPPARIAAEALRYGRAALTRRVKRAIGLEGFRRRGAAPAPDRELLAPLEEDGGPETGKPTDPVEIDLRAIRRGRIFFDSLLDCYRKNMALLVRLEDRSAMAHGLDLCAPFMDHELVEAGLAFPFQRYLEGGRNKAVLRTAVKGLLAPEVSGFSRKLATPGNNDHVVFEALGPRFLDRLRSESFRSSGLWSGRCAELFETDSRTRARASSWFRVYVVAEWHERVVRGSPSERPAGG